MKPTVKSLLQEGVVLLADSRVKIAIVTLVLNILGIIGLAKYGDIATKAVTAGNLVAGLLIAGISYEKGKAAEGTVPAGQQSVYTPLVDPGKAADLLTEINAKLESPEVKDVLGAIGPKAPAPGGNGPKAAAIGLVLALTMLAVGGCATSEPAQLMVSQVGPVLATNAGRYVTADTTLNTADRTSRTDQISVFKQVATQKSIDGRQTAEAWSPVEGFYRAYLNSDTKLSATELAERLAVVQHFDGVLQDDAARPFAALGNLFTPVPALPAPVPATLPATQPTTNP